MSTSVVVIGAGVIGLTTALLLQKKGYQVTILAKYVPGDMNIEYTSPYSGAHWRTMIPNDQKDLQENDAVAYNVFYKIGESLPSDTTGVMIIPALDCWSERNDDTANPWWKDVVKDFRFVEKKELFPDTVIGHSYTTVAVNTPHYMQWLVRLFTQSGGKLKRATLAHVQDALKYCPDAQSIVNCTGLQARFLGGVKDEKVYPTRGQVVVVNAPHIKKTLTSMVGDGTSYIIPRSNGHVILGGTRQAHDFNSEVDMETAKEIMEKTVRLLPELAHGKGVKGLDIVRHNVGLRPSREGGPRIENEMTTTTSGKPLLITHCYGHGGYGVQSSWGSAKKAVDLVTQGLFEKDNKVIDSIVSDLWSKL
ncbi:FAD dependent oxidoreductase [Umbelopsis sp. AD052]|nr:FAD dependent oxidoreductase [Umbelopsis sp. AD052]